MPRLINQVSLTNKRAIQNQQEERRYVYDANHSLIRYGQKSEEGTHTIYEPGSFIPLIRIEGPKQAAMQSLAQKIEQQAGEKLSGEHLRLLDRIERQLRAGSLDARTEQHLIKIGATPQMMRDMLNDWPALEGKTIHYYHCDHLGTPTALINKDGEVDWSVELDAWGNVIKEHNPKNIDQPIRFQGQHFDEESGLHYNRHRYYDPKLGRYITQDPTGLRGGSNIYIYPGDPYGWIDPTGLECKKEASSSNAPSSNINPQVENAANAARDGALTAATARNTLTPSGVVATGGTAAEGAVAIGAGYKAVALEAYREYMATGGDRRPASESNKSKCIFKEMETIKWEEYCTFEDAWAALGKICMKK